MRKILAFVAAILTGLSALAVPAFPGIVSYTQPDGTVVRIQLHGDEFFSWTTLAGTSQVVELGKDGFWHPATLSAQARKEGRRMRALANEERLSVRTHDSNPMTHGERHIPVLLLEFQDVHFSLDNLQERFSNLLDQQGYSYNGATGSVQDYYRENSDGQFIPIFDVYGPVTLPNDMAYYGAMVKDESGAKIKNDIHADLALYHGCQLLDPVIDFSQYDYDKDGYVDMTLFYYAGYNQAEHGPEDAIWAHQGNLRSSSEVDNVFDGKRVSRYFCTSELRGKSGTEMCSIGTTCHEFGHSLGLPDFYDTDYEENGSCGGLYYFSIMCYGNYNNNGRTPPWFNAEERIFLGWMSEDDIRPLQEGSLSFGPARNSVAYFSETGIDGEYFLYECLDGNKWNEPLPTGLLVYHVDKSKVRTVGGYTPFYLWDQWRRTNEINAYGDHPCFYVVPSADQSNLDYEGALAEMVFPGNKGIKVFSPTDWDGNNQTGLRISNISYAGGKVSLTVSYSGNRTLSGQVTTLTGAPLEGVYVQLSPLAANAPREIRFDTQNLSPETLTNENGEFFIDLDGFDDLKGHLTLSRSGYQTAGFDVELDQRFNYVQFQLLRRDQGESHLYYYYDASSGFSWIGSGSTGNTRLNAILIPGEELPAGESRLEQVSLRCRGTSDEAIVVVEQNGVRKTFPFTPEDGTAIEKQTVDLSAHDIRVSGGKDLYVGYGLKNTGNGYPYYGTKGGNNFYRTNYSTSATTWSKNGSWSLFLEALIVEVRDGGDDPEQMGVPCIADPLCGSYSAGDSFQLVLEVPDGMSVSSESWTFDGENVTGAKSVTLQAGQHILSAKVKWADGSEETFTLALDVK